MGSRNRMKAQLDQETRYDLMIIGGGITGCGVAWEAAARGGRVLVLEQGDFASGTSSRSTKLIHGGIRYLKQFDFRLVREGVHERQNLIEAAPHLVHPAQFVYPVHAGDPDSLLALRAGLVLYDLFAGRRNLLRHKVFPGRAILSQEPLLKEDGLRGGAFYADCITDDARLTAEVARAAAAAGATLVNYMEVRAFLYDDAGRICGVEASDVLTGERFILRAGAVLNATGPWADRLRRLDDANARPVLRPTKGVHISVPHERLKVARPVVMHAADRRLMFAVPRDGLTYLGTTDTDYKGDPAKVAVDREDVTYILAAANRMFPTAALTEEDVVSAWAGIRSLAATSETAGPSQVSRDYKLYPSPSGLITVAGGKLTAFQAMARSIVDKVLPNLPRNTRQALELPGAAAAPAPAEAEALGAEFGLAAAEVLELWSRHGSAARDVLAYTNPTLPESRVRLLAAEAAYAVEQEFAVTLADVLVRRTAQLLFSRDHGLGAAPAVAAAMAEHLGWDEAEEAAQLTAYQLEVTAMFAWRQGRG